MPYHNTNDFRAVYKKEIKKKNKVRASLNWLVIGDYNSISVYKVFANTQLVSWTDIEPLTAITTQPEKSLKKMKIKSKDRDSNVLVVFSSSKALRAIQKTRRVDSLMLATIRDDTWNVLHMQHITPNLNRWDYSNIPGDGHKKIKGPNHMVEGGHLPRNVPNPHPQCFKETVISLTKTCRAEYHIKYSWLFLPIHPPWHP